MLSKILKTVVLLYALYFLIGAFAAPIFAHNHQLENADYFYSAFTASCQQQSSRTFWLLGYPMALCSRCLGVYLGFTLTGIFWVKGSLNTNKLFFLGLFSLGIAEKLLEWFIWESNNQIRFLSGMLLGGAILVGLAIIVQFVRRLLGKNESEKITLFGA